MGDRPTTIGALRASGYPDRTVKQEVAANAAARLRAGRPIVEGLVGFDDTVLPALETALLAGHDVILLGERGQAKSRILRSLVALLDDAAPIIAGSEVRDHPYHPFSAQARALVAEHGDDTPITWVPREDRYAEKLATPDISVADLIGDVDPIKVAEGRHLGDELTVHYGLVPRHNRGIVTINELPDLAERIQVALLNVMEERDVQVRGYSLRLPLDLLVVATANPEDYTNRGRIITPLKDRFGAEVRTHYPLDLDGEVQVMRQEATIDGLDGLAGGILLFCFAAYTALAFALGRIELAIFCAAIAGGILAFLWHNVYPAKFFMGDTGAMSLGTTLGVIAMLTNSALILPIIAFPLVAESGSVIIQVLSKKLRGKKVFLSAPIHHHFEALGWPETQVTMRFWIIAAVSAGLGLVIGLLGMGS
jgi:MoxR-like ATPase